MSKAVQLYPHAVSTSLDLRASDFDDPVSGQTVAVRELTSIEAGDEGVSSIISGYDAYTSSGSWRKLTFRLRAELSTQELERILPPTSSVISDTSVFVQMTCPSTRFRHGVRLKAVEKGVWTGVATLQRDDVKGALTMRAQMARSTGIPADEDLPYATKAGALIAFGPSVSLYVDELSISSRLLQSTVMMSWEDFTNSDHVWRREHSDDVFHLEPFGQQPRLYLNSRYAQLREVMESEAKRGPEAVLRDMTAALIAQPVLLQLATVAISALQLDEDSGSVDVPTGWRAQVLSSVLPSLYPEQFSDDERLQRAAHEIREADGAASLLARLGSVVQEMLASYKTVEAAVRTLEATRDRDEGTNE